MKYFTEGAKPRARMVSMKSPDFKAGEQNIYTYQQAHPWATLRYALKLVLGR